MKKKLLTAVALTLAAVTLVVTSVMATVAYLTASSAVSNVFTVGNVAITMYETKVDNNGVVITPETKVDANSYHLVPGNKYTKDPAIKITSTLDQDKMYLFVKSSNQIRQVEAGNFKDRQDDRENATDLSMREQMEKNGWVEFVRSGNGIEIVWVYGTRNTDGTITPTAVGPNDKQPRDDGTDEGTTGPAGEFRLCEYFQLHKNADVSIYSSAKVNFTGFAIQSSGFGTDNANNKIVIEAWDALKATYPFEGGIINPVNPYKSSAEPYAPVPKSVAANATFDLLDPPVTATTTTTSTPGSN